MSESAWPAMVDPWGVNWSEWNEHNQTDQEPVVRRAGGAVHEGYARFPAVRVLGTDRIGAQSVQGAIRPCEYIRGSRGARGAEDLLQLADLSSALRQWRADRRVRHRHPDVQERRTEAIARGSRGRDGLNGCTGPIGTCHVDGAGSLIGRDRTVGFTRRRGLTFQGSHRREAP